MVRISIWKKIVCVQLALVLLLACGLVIIVQRENVTAVVLSKVMDRDSLSDRMGRVRQQNQQILEEQGVTVPGLRQEDLNQLLKGTMTEDAAVSALGLEDYQSADSTDDLVNQCVAELYRYQAALYAQLGSIRQEARATWKSYPKSERTNSLKQSIKMDALSQCYALEANADEQISAILDQYRSEVETAGGDPSRIDSLWGVYSSEKASVKAYYLKIIQQKKEDNSQ